MFTNAICNMSEQDRKALGNQVAISADGSVGIGGDNLGSITINNVFPSAVAARPSVSRLLPTPMADQKFIGRGTERRRLKQILKRADSEKVALAGLHGMGGVGKSELAIYVANQISDAFPDGQIYIKLY